MGMRISSIQAREQVDIKDMPTGPQTKSLEVNLNPIPKELPQQLDRYADFIAKKEAAALKNAQNVREAMVRNKFADFESEATLKVMEAQGENTYKATDDAGKKLKEKMEKELMKVPAQYRTEYQNFADDSIRNFNKTSQGRMITEGRKAGEEAFKRRGEDLTSKIALNAYDKNEFEVGLQNLDQTVEAHTQLTMGADSPRAQELADVHKKQAKSTAIIKTLEVLTASGDVRKAKEIAQGYEASLTSKDRATAYKLLEEGKKKRDYDTAKAEGDRLWDVLGNDESAAAAAIAKLTTDGQLARDIQANYSARVAIEKRAAEKQRKDTFGDVQSSIIKTGRFTTEDRMKLDPLDVKAAQELYVKVSRGELIPRNNAVYNKMIDMYIYEPSKFSQETFKDIQWQMPGDDIKYLRRLQEKLIDPAADRFKPTSYSYILQEAIKGIRAKKGSAKYEQDLAYLQEAFTEAYNNSIAASGERPDPSELGRKIRENFALATMKMEDQRTLWEKVTFRDKKMAPAQQSPADKAAPRFNSGAEPAALADYPEGLKERIRKSYLKSKGKNISNENLLKTLVHLKNKK